MKTVAGERYFGLDAHHHETLPYLFLETTREFARVFCTKRRKGKFMKFHMQTKKILLLRLIQVEDEKLSPGEWRDWRKRTIKGLAKVIDKKSVFDGGGYLYPSKQGSYNRTLLKLEAEGYVTSCRHSRKKSYNLTEKGVNKAEELKQEILNLIKEWKPFVKC